jgi:hypothetical protein
LIHTHGKYLLFGAKISWLFRSDRFHGSYKINPMIVSSYGCSTLPMLKKRRIVYETREQRKKRKKSAHCLGKEREHRLVHTHTHTHTYTDMCGTLLLRK